MSAFFILFGKRKTFVGLSLLVIFQFCISGNAYCQSDSNLIKGTWKIVSVHSDFATEQLKELYKRAKHILEKGGTVPHFDYGSYDLIKILHNYSDIEWGISLWVFQSKHVFNGYNIYDPRCRTIESLSWSFSSGQLLLSGINSQKANIKSLFAIKNLTINTLVLSIDVAGLKQTITFQRDMENTIDQFVREIPYFIYCTDMSLDFFKGTWINLSNTKSMTFNEIRIKGDEAQLLVDENTIEGFDNSNYYYLSKSTKYLKDAIAFYHMTKGPYTFENGPMGAGNDISYFPETGQIYLNVISHCSADTLSNDKLFIRK